MVKNYNIAVLNVLRTSSIIQCHCTYCTMRAAEYRRDADGATGLLSQQDTHKYINILKRNTSLVTDTAPVH